MKLFVSATSPFVRKVRIVIREKDLTGQIDEISVVPVEGRSDLLAANPLSQIPALVDDDEVRWTGSELISAWLDQRDTGPKLLPLAGTDDYWRARRVEVAATGLLETMAKMVYESRRPEAERSQFWLRRWQDNLMRGFEHANAICPNPDVLDIGAITLAIAGTFCEFRFGYLDWRTLAPRVGELNSALEMRQSFIDTYPR